MPVAPQPLHIAIVGYGAAGQAAAITLGRLPNVQVTVFEQTAEPGPVGAGFLLQPTGLAALERLGGLPQALAHGAPVHALTGHNHRDRHVMDMRYAQWRAGAHGLGMQRHALYTLLDRLRPDGVALRAGTAVSRIDPESGTLTDTLGHTHGPFSLVVVAEGSRSPLRTQVFGQASARPYPWGAWWCLVPARGWRDAGELRQRYRLARHMIGVLPVGHAPGLPERMLCLYWSVPATHAPEGRDSHALAADLHALWPEIAEQVRSHPAVALIHATYRAVTLKRWRRGRAVWIGDAAHGMSPQLGQGVNLALLDALALGDAVSGAPRDRASLDAALDRFEAERRRHVRWYRWGSHALTPLFQSEHDLLARLRDLAFAPSGRLPVIRGLSHRLLTGTLGLPNKLY
jgi:2-polyprenyl-6-methoxyphenol hydroxylase-like FAD-dependent oxidoreductase